MGPADHEGRWRVSGANAKTGKARWITQFDVVFDAVVALCPRDDRTATRRVFEGVTADRLRTALTRACTVGISSFSPHDLRHRRATLMHLGNEPSSVGRGEARPLCAGALADVRAAVVDRTELDYAALLTDSPTIRST